MVKMALLMGKKLMGFLGDRFRGKPIKIEFEGNGKKIKVSAYSKAELKVAIKAVEDFAEHR